MKYNIAIVSLASLSLFVSANVMADNDDYYHRDHDRGYREQARVVDVDPIYRNIRVSEPRRECWDEPAPRQRYYHRESYTGTIAGGIIGGVIGNQFGNGNGKTAMTVAGTLLGGSIGRDMNYAPTREPGQRYQQTCRLTERYHNESVIDGYHVTYRYRGRLYTTNMDHRPGRFIPVDVDVRPRHYRD